jgi:protein-S-isoprenylcysteine O-methyltransferase Ste14
VLRFGSIKSAVFVILQFFIIIYYFLTGSIFPKNIFLLIIYSFGLFLGLYSIIIMKFNFNIAPDLKSGAIFIKRGPYKFIRHPMYTSVIIIILSLLINYFSIIRFVLFIVLITVLILKSNYEEKILKEEFKEYSSYIFKTKKFLPYIY